MALTLIVRLGVTQYPPLGAGALASAFKFVEGEREMITERSEAGPVGAINRASVLVDDCPQPSGASIDIDSKTGEKSLRSMTGKSSMFSARTKIRERRGKFDGLEEICASGTVFVEIASHGLDREDLKVREFMETVREVTSTVETHES